MTGRQEFVEDASGAVETVEPDRRFVTEESLYAPEGGAGGPLVRVRVDKQAGGRTLTESQAKRLAARAGQLVREAIMRDMGKAEGREAPKPLHEMDDQEFHAHAAERWAAVPFGGRALAPVAETAAGRRPVAAGAPAKAPHQMTDEEFRDYRSRALEGWAAPGGRR